MENLIIKQWTKAEADEWIAKSLIFSGDLDMMGVPKANHKEFELAMMNELLTNREKTEIDNNYADMSIFISSYKDAEIALELNDSITTLTLAQVDTLIEELKRIKSILNDKSE